MSAAPSDTRISLEELADAANPHEVAAFPGVNVSTIYHLLQTRQMPGVKIGRRWRIYKPRLLGWLDRGGRIT